MLFTAFHVYHVDPDICIYIAFAALLRNLRYYPVSLREVMIRSRSCMQRHDPVNSDNIRDECATRIARRYRLTLE